MRHYWIVSAKVALAVALLSYLVVQAQRHESFRRLVEQPKDWGLLALAVVLLMAAAVLTFSRWFLLVRALGLEFRLRDAMRLGSLGYVLNLISLGSVGGDFFKAVLIARDQPGKRTEAVATVIFDRLVGLYALLLVAAGAGLLSGVRTRGAAVAAVCDAAVVSAVVVTFAFVVLMIPAVTGPRSETTLERVHVVGPTLARLLAAVRVYRSRPLTVLVSVLMSVGVHILLSLAVLCVANGLPGEVPDWTDHFVLVPLSMVVGAVPLTPNGLGTFDAAMESLYQLLGASGGVVHGTGTIVAFGYRLTNIVVAGIFALYYLAVSGRLPTFGAADAVEAKSGKVTAIEQPGGASCR